MHSNIYCPVILLFFVFGTALLTHTLISFLLILHPDISEDSDKGSELQFRQCTLLCFVGQEQAIHIPVIV